MFRRGWEHGTATIVSRRNSEGIRATLRDTQFGRSWMYDYVADIQPDSGGPAFRATFSVHFGGQLTGRKGGPRPNEGQQARVFFDPRTKKVVFDHAALKKADEDANQANRDSFDATASSPPHSATAGGDQASPHQRSAAHDTLAQLERLAALHERGALSDDEFAAEKTKLLGGH